MTLVAFYGLSSKISASRRVHFNFADQRATNDLTSFFNLNRRPVRSAELALPRGEEYFLNDKGPMEPSRYGLKERQHRFPNCDIEAACRAYGGKISAVRGYASSMSVMAICEEPHLQD